MLPNQFIGAEMGMANRLLIFVGRVFQGQSGLGVTSPLSVLGIPTGIPTTGYPSLSFDPCRTRGSGLLEAFVHARQPSFFSVGTASLTFVGSSRSREREKVRLLVRLTADSVGQVPRNGFLDTISGEGRGTNRQGALPLPNGLRRKQRAKPTSGRSSPTSRAGLAAAVS